MPEEPEELQPEEPIEPDSGTVEPPREIELEKRKDEGGGGGQSYEEGENNANLTDLQATLHRLFPEFPYKIFNLVAQPIMMARTAPDMFLDAMRLTVNSVVQEMDLMGIEFDVQSVINMVYTAFSISLDGKGRIEALEAAGAAKETEELEKLSKQLGM